MEAPVQRACCHWEHSLWAGPECCASPSTTYMVCTGRAAPPHCSGLPAGEEDKMR
jgi:hypothetical protein